MKRQKVLATLLITAGIAGIFALGLHSVLNYMPDTSVRYEFIAPPNGHTPDYIASTQTDMELAITGHYGAIWDVEQNMGQSFVLKNISVTKAGLSLNSTQPNLSAGYLMFFPQKFSDLAALKPGDTVDILCEYAGPSKEWVSLSTFTNAVFLPSSSSPFPLPGGAVLGGY